MERGLARVPAPGPALVPRSAPPLAGIFGSGRSGTSWLGAIVDSSPGVAYRFEPFHRSGVSPSIAAARAVIDGANLDDERLWAVYDGLLAAHPATCKPPFFPKDHCWNFGRRWLWPLARKMSMFQRLYGAAYRPTPGTMVVFKEVTMERLMARLLASTHLKAIYLVRHPCAVVSSLEAGQSQGHMAVGRLAVLKGLLEEHDSLLAEEYGSRLESMNVWEKNALLWRMETEVALTAVNSSKLARLIVYEDLCQSPLDRATEVFQHLDVPFGDATERFLTTSTKVSRGSRLLSGEFLIERYFSVFRDPRESMNKWRTILPAAAQAQVLEIVRGSAAFQQLLAYGFWD